MSFHCSKTTCGEPLKERVIQVRKGEFNADFYPDEDLAYYHESCFSDASNDDLTTINHVSIVDGETDVIQEYVKIHKFTYECKRCHLEYTVSLDAFTYADHVEKYRRRGHQYSCPLCKSNSEEFISLVDQTFDRLPNNQLE